MACLYGGPLDGAHVDPGTSLLSEVPSAQKTYHLPKYDFYGLAWVPDSGGNRVHVYVWNGFRFVYSTSKDNK